MKKVFLALAATLFATAAWAQTNLAVPAGTALKVKLDRMLTTFSNKAWRPVHRSCVGSRDARRKNYYPGRCDRGG